MNVSATADAQLARDGSHLRLAVVHADESVHADEAVLALVPPDRVPAAVEAVLLVTDVPLPAAVIAEALGVETGAVRAALEQLRRDYDDTARGFGLVEVAGGWRLATRPEFAGVIERHLREGQRVRLTQAALEALAVVAYQQPVTRALVSSVRGVASDGVLRTLVARGLVEECGSDDSGALRYRTTPAFLEKLGLNELADLPPLAPHLPDLGELAEPADVTDLADLSRVDDEDGAGGRPGSAAHAGRGDPRPETDALPVENT